MCSPACKEASFSHIVYTLVMWTLRKVDTLATLEQLPVHMHACICITLLTIGQARFRGHYMSSEINICIQNSLLILAHQLLLQELAN